MKRISIIGVGLIGGSLGMALRSPEKPAYKVTGIGRNIDKLRLAKKLGAIDEYTLDWPSGVRKADIVVVCTPVELVAETIKKLTPYLKDGAIVTDVGSVKGSIVKDVNKIVERARNKYKRSITFVGGHPMAGSEKTGVQFGDKNLYKGATVVIARETATKGSSINKVKKMWQDAGANVIVTTPSSHDKIVALISHLPHMIAFSLCLLARDLNKKDRHVSKFLAGSFKDLTRITNSSPSDWAGICKHNQKELQLATDKFVGMLLKIKNRLNSKNKTEKTFLAAKIARQKLLNI